MNRLETLRQYVKEDPADPFNHYALALEVMKQDSRESIQLLTYLVREFPVYLPSYYPLARLLHESGDHKTAVDILEKGIEVAQSAQDLKTMRELQTELSDIESDQT